MQINLPDLEMEVVMEGNGTSAVLLHGVGLDHTIWQPMVDLYASQMQFVLPDLRGQGKTQLNQADQTIEQMAEDILALIDNLALEKIVLGGHSMGGYVALAFAEKHPERLSGLVMIATNAGADPDAKKAQRYLDAEAIRQSGSKILAASLSPKLSGDPQIQSDMYELIANTSREGLANTQIAIARRPERFQVLASLTCPILVVAGAEDKIIPLEAAQAMAKANPKAKFVVIPGVGHMPMLEAPKTLGALLLTL